MIQTDQLSQFFPPFVQENPGLRKYMMKEYIQLLILDYLSMTPYVRKISFIGGTNLRLVKGTDRFSEDLDFDCKDFSEAEFMEMSDAVLLFLQRSGFRAETRDKVSKKVKAYRRNFYFPEFLLRLGLSGHKDERFLIKIESQDQKIRYESKMVNIKGCGFYFIFPVPSDSILCAMKLTALFNRQKGRDFYDVMFILGQTEPDYTFLAEKCGIASLSELKSAVAELLDKIDLRKKSKDFEHLLFNKSNSSRILAFGEFIKNL